MDTQRRTLCKTITSKAIEIGMSAVIVQVIFKQPLISIGLPTLLEAAQMIVYYVHERVWSRVKWGNGACKNCPLNERRQSRNL